jgi:beta-lactamase regulating signal transducer with metallopeptidase domain
MILYDFLYWQLRGTIVIAVGYVLLAAGFRWLRIESPTVRLVAVSVVLLAALLPISLPVNVPWYPPVENADLAQVDANDASLFVISKVDIDQLTSTEQRHWRLADAANTTPASSAIKIVWPHIGRPIRLLSLIAVTWIVGIALIVLAGLWHYLAVVREARRPLAAKADWLRQWRELLSAHAIATPLPLIITRCAGPLLGLLPRGYCLLVPQTYWQTLAPRQRRTVLRHELAHYQRGDVPASCVLRLLALPFWYHPLAWRLVALFEEATEWACDRAASGESDGVTYAQALEQLLQTNYSTIPLALGRCAQAHPLVTRVRRVLNPIPPQESFMKTMLFAAALAVAALVSVVQIRLVAQDKGEVTLETVKADLQRMRSRLDDLKSAAEQADSNAKTLEANVKDKLDVLKALAEDPTRISADGLKRAELLRSDDETKQLEALAGAEKLGDEGLLLCAHAAKEIDRESVRQKAITIACSLGNDGLPVIAKAYESLPAKERLLVVTELAKQKERVDSIIFTRLAKDGEEENRVEALKVILSRSDPLIYLVLTIAKNEEIGRTAFPLALNLKGDDLELFLFAFASKGPEELLPQIVKKAGELKEKGYPAVAAAYQRKTADSRAEIVRLYRKSTVPIEQYVVDEALRDGDETLRLAAEAAKNE